MLAAHRPQSAPLTAALAPVLATTILAVTALSLACGTRATRGADTASAELEGALGPDWPRDTDWPPGTVLAVDAVPLAAADVDRFAEALRLLHPEHTLPHRRRTALTGLLFARAAVHAAYPDEREAAMERALGLRAELVLGEESGVAEPQAPDRIEPVRAGSLPLEVWEWVRDSEEGEWSLPLEGVGKFTLARRLSYNGLVDHLRVEQREVGMELALDNGPQRDSTMNSILDDRLLTIVDPEWAAVVPASWRHLMRGDTK